MDDFPIKFRFVEGIAVVSVEGELDAHTAPLLGHAFGELIARDRHRIVLDCRELAYMSSAAFGLLIAFVEETRDRGGSVKLADLHYRVSDFLAAMQYPFLPPVYDTVDEAVTSFLRGD
ncbi:MAG: STAS domain-containing protein [Rhodothermales bacterium]|nr:STAS domain-containing protein [Rhodothermales bacterium]